MTFAIDYHTETAGTIITDVIPPKDGKVAKLRSLDYRVAGTAHTITIMRAVAKTSALNSAASGQTKLRIKDFKPGRDTSGDPEAVAASDFFIWKDKNGQFQHDIASGITAADNEVTMTSNLPSDVDEGAPVWVLYEVGRAVHFVLTPAINTTREFRGLEVAAGIPLQLDHYNVRDGVGDPMLIHSDNGTADGFLDRASGVYVDSSEIAVV